MPLTGLSVEELQNYLPERSEPPDFGSFWASTLADAAQAAWEPVFQPVKTPLSCLTVEDVTFSGFAGHPVRGWLIRPRDADRPLACQVTYLGYTGGRGYPHEWTQIAATGRAQFIMDNRGQGGGVALAAAGLLGGQVARAVIDFPFLRHIRHAVKVATASAYRLELFELLAHNPGLEERALRTLDYFDGLNFAVRAKVPALFSTGLVDDICPPSTVFAAYNHYAGPKQIAVYPYNGHEGGGAFHRARQLAFLDSPGLTKQPSENPAPRS